MYYNYFIALFLLVNFLTKRSGFMAAIPSMNHAEILKLVNQLDELDAGTVTYNTRIKILNSCKLLLLSINGSEAIVSDSEKKLLTDRICVLYDRNCIAIKRDHKEIYEDLSKKCSALTIAKIHFSTMQTHAELAVVRINEKIQMLELQSTHLSRDLANTHAFINNESFSPPNRQAAGERLAQFDVERAVLDSRLKLLMNHRDHAQNSAYEAQVKIGMVVRRTLRLNAESDALDNKLVDTLAKPFWDRIKSMIEPKKI